MNFLLQFFWWFKTSWLPTSAPQFANTSYFAFTNVWSSRMAFFSFFWCVFTWFTSRSQFVSAHSMNNSQTFFHGSASLWLGLMHLFALPQPPLTMPRFSFWVMSKPINPDCVMVKASKSDKNVSQIVNHGSSCLSLSDSTLPPKHKPHPVLVLLSMNHQLPCFLPEIWRFSHTYGKYKMHFGFENSQMFPISSWCVGTTPITAVISIPNLLTSLSSRKIWPHSGSYAFPPSMRCNGTIVAPPCIPHYNSVNFCCQPNWCRRTCVRQCFNDNPMALLVMYASSSDTIGLSFPYCFDQLNLNPFVQISNVMLLPTNLLINFFGLPQQWCFYVCWTKIIRTDKAAISHPQKLLIRWHYSKKPSFRKNHDCWSSDCISLNCYSHLTFPCFSHILILLSDPDC